jgi:ankyrin repeat protein
MVEFLLQKGANVSARHQYGWELVVIGGWERAVRTAAKLKDVNIVNLLIRHGASLLDRDSLNRLPFHHAVMQADLPIMKWHLNEMINAIKLKSPKTPIRSLSLGRIL